MNLRNLVLHAFSVLFFLAFILGTSHATFAQNSASVQIQPATIESSANPNDVLNKAFVVKNLSDAEQTYYLVVRDISGVTENNVPVFADPNAEKTGYELSSWIGVSVEPFTLKPNEQKEVPIIITVPGNASPGSHFGGVFVTVQPPKLREVGASVGYEVGAIISIKISGDIVENARIREFSTDKLIYSKPEVNFKIRVENPGNVLIRPYGPLEIMNMTGERVALINVNDSLGGVFPGTTREITSSWSSDRLAFGRYQAIVALLYGEAGNQTTVSATVSFWVLPAHILLPVLGGLAFIALAIYFGVRLHIERTLARMERGNGSRRVIPRRVRKEEGITRLAMVALTLLFVSVLFLIGLLILFA